MDAQEKLRQDVARLFEEAVETIKPLLSKGMKLEVIRRGWSHNEDQSKEPICELHVVLATTRKDTSPPRLEIKANSVNSWESHKLKLQVDLLERGNYGRVWKGPPRQLKLETFKEKLPGWLDELRAVETRLVEESEVAKQQDGLLAQRTAALKKAGLTLEESYGTRGAWYATNDAFIYRPEHSSMVSTSGHGIMLCYAVPIEELPRCIRHARTLGLALMVEL